MNDVQGAFFSYKDFRQSLHQPPLGARVWTADELAEVRQRLETSEVDIVALAHEKTIEGCKLTPGMAVSVEIKTGKRRVIEYFLAPLMQTTNESLRER